MSKRLQLGQSELSRRDLLRGGAVLGMAVAGSSFLAACSSATTSSPKAKPRLGGTFRVGVSGGGSADTLDPLNPISNADFARIQNLYDPLAVVGADGTPELVLAEEITSNSDGSVWTIRIRKGVQFHNGRALTSKDVAFTLRRILDPKAGGAAAAGLSLINAAEIKELDAHTLSVPCRSPFATLKESLSIAGYSNIVPVGFDPKRPVGTGPFELVSFTPGRQSVFKKNVSYWRQGRPYLDKVVITDYADETSQVNALLANQVDAVNLLSSDSLAQIKSANLGSVISNGGGWNPFTMRVDSAPLSDVRVRQALRLSVDRPQMLSLVYGGHGTIGNDVFGIWSADYDHQLPQRERDTEQARSLLRSAGQSDLQLELVTSPIAQGATKAAQVFAQQLSGSGVRAKIRQVSVTDFFGSNYLQWPLAQDYWYYNYYLPQVSLATLRTSPFNETHFNDAKYGALYLQAVATVDDQKRAELAGAMQRIDYDQGGYIIPCFPGVIDGYATNVHGFVPSKSGLSLNGYQFTDIFLS